MRLTARKEKIMTKREFFEQVQNGVITEEMQAFAAKEITAMDERNAKRSTKPNAKQIENEAIKEKIIEAFTGKSKALASAIGEAMGISTNKASALCRQLVAENRMTVEEVKVPKKGMQKAYTVV